MPYTFDFQVIKRLTTKPSRCRFSVQHQSLQRLYVDSFYPVSISYRYFPSRSNQLLSLSKKNDDFTFSFTSNNFTLPQFNRHKSQYYQSFFISTDGYLYSILLLVCKEMESHEHYDLVLHPTTLLHIMWFHQLFFSETHGGFCVRFLCV